MRAIKCLDVIWEVFGPIPGVNGDDQICVNCHTRFRTRFSISVRVRYVVGESKLYSLASCCSCILRVSVMAFLMPLTFFFVSD